MAMAATSDQDPRVRSPRRRRGEPLAIRATDPCRRLRGEPLLDASTLVDARLWIDVYQEMLAFQEQLVLDVEHRLRGIVADATRRELGQINGAALESLRDRFGRRLALWKQREVELAAGGGCCPPARRTGKQLAEADQLIWR
jgi:hypothetical protein